MHFKSDSAHVVPCKKIKVNADPLCLCCVVVCGAWLEEDLTRNSNMFSLLVIPNSCVMCRI